MAARFLVRPGDVPIGGSSGERAEVLKATGEAAGTVSLWGWSVYFPRGSASSPNSQWNVFTQWHQSGSDGVQPFSFEISNEQGREWLRLRVWGGNIDTPVRRAWILGRLERGHWYDFALRVRWAPDASGSVQVWLDRRTVVPETHTPTLYAGQSVYLKQGFYRAPSAVTSELFIADTRRGASLADIGITGAAAKAAPAPAKPKSKPKPAVVASRPTSVRSPTIVGLAKEGRILGSSPGTWSKKPTRFTYQWQWSTDGGTTWMNVMGATRADLRRHRDLRPGESEGGREGLERLRLDHRVERIGFADPLTPGLARLRKSEFSTWSGRSPRPVATSSTKAT